MVAEQFGEWEQDKVLTFLKETEPLPKLIIQILLTHSAFLQMHY